ncbi:hypothetical protein SUGI_0897860 [Cryptomeria japonica]|uniref:uncharacterized protein LOC131077912 n=1 Tax=Cryptomeria japonica TaxID=3369 RepID=UPI002414A67B|nr:uncharacterized protein LOC131077912 [Cryptomeria japonica]GLJ43244.1 hypothetical protein SUGI_0897860 [Cryptomeria japonica]
MDDSTNMRPRKSRSSKLLSLFCCFSGSDDSTAERSLLKKPSWFHKVRRSNSGPDMDADSHKWWRNGWNSVRRAGEWSETLGEDYAGGCCSRAKWKHFVRRCKADGKTIYDSKPKKFHYDRMSYQLNFDEGREDFQDQLFLPENTEA